MYELRDSKLIRVKEIDYATTVPRVYLSSREQSFPEDLDFGRLTGCVVLGELSGVFIARIGEYYLYRSFTRTLPKEFACKILPGSDIKSKDLYFLGPPSTKKQMLPANQGLLDYLKGQVIFTADWLKKFLVQLGEEEIPGHQFRFSRDGKRLDYESPYLYFDDTPVYVPDLRKFL